MNKPHTNSIFYVYIEKNEYGVRNNQMDRTKAIIFVLYEHVE